jgi:heterodisulfide reductase subunit A-like polyferredoxin
MTIMITNEIKKTGAVLVQGGGIAGVQSALDLANSGFKVYLVESSPSIGGMMAHLDKTFPTGDCATCIVSPKLVECARNLNIEILTRSELVGLDGQPGNFTAKVKRNPGYVNEDKCTACGDCTRACPVDIDDHFDRNLGKRKAIAKRYAQAVPNVFGINKNGHAPCKTTCPANINVQGYVQLIKKKEYVKAVELVRQRNPLSAICGRICTHPCESACTRGDVDSPVAIRLLKRFASDKEMEMIKSGELALPEEKTPAVNARKVAVIGSGPAGLTAANDLADRGFAVTIYEALSLAGGMLRWGIPQYRLPDDVLGYEIELIRRKGVTFVMNCRVGKDITFDQLREENESVFVSVGVHKSRSLGIEGEDKTGVIQGVDFLRQAGSPDDLPEVKGNVIVIGGGNVAVDVARTALRLGAKSVELVSLEQQKEMPAYDEEITATLDEGIKIRNGWGPRGVFGNGSVEGIELKRCTSVFGYDGRFNPVFNENDRVKIDADQIYIAIGQKNDEELFGHLGLENERGSIKADPITLATSVDGVFAGGDTVTGPASVIEAVAAGKRAADSIEMYLKDEDINVRAFDDSIRSVPEELLPSTDNIEKANRAESEELLVSNRMGNFNEVETGCSEEAAIAEAERCLNCALCSECGECARACEPDAVDYEMKEETVDLEVGAVILAPGFEEFAAEAKGEYGFGRYPNVVTSVQFERVLSAAGPYAGHVVRPSDEKEAKRIAWIQCVGSRDSSCGNDYCSSICCMASTKQAMIAQDHLKGLEASIFYMDIRAHGKDFDQYYERAKATDGINYIKSMPSRIMQMPGSDDLRLRFVADDGTIIEQEFDMVVLSVGLTPPESVKQCAQDLGIELNEYGFCATDRLEPLSTSRAGIFVAGAFQEPKDIPETVVQASGAASKAMELLSKVRGTMVTQKAYPAEHDVTDEEARIGVFVCHCGINIASVVDVEHVTESIANEPGVVFADHTMFTCSDTSLSNIKSVIHEHRLNRIVVASCTPRTHEPLFRETLREAGLNPYLFELTNIRDQCSWVHADEPQAATKKAIELVKMSIARSHLLKSLEGSTLEVNQSGIVFGGGMSGMTAALSLAEQGFDVSLIEKENALGGNLLDICRTLEREDISDFKKDLIERTNSNPNITVHLNSEITNVAGHIGKFNVTIEKDGSAQQVAGGAIILATGAEPAKTDEYLYGQSDAVMTQKELEKALADNTYDAAGKNVVMIQCVGSRNEENPYCSRICCTTAVKNALSIKEKDPSANVYVLYRDIRTYGFRETYYKKARQKGVVFMRYDVENPPQVTNGDCLNIAVKSPDFPEQINFKADNLILSTGVKAPDSNETISNMLKVPLNAAGFYVEAHLKLRPVDFATEGIYLCGLAHSPKQIDENISQARAAASRAATVLSKSVLDVSAQVSYVDQNKCISCMTCVHACPYNAPFVNVDGKGQIEAAMCMGCGICASECPARAIELHHFEADKFKVMIDELFA